jgi:2-haloacid dehalogenase
MVAQVLSVDDVQAWKPARAPYEYALRCAGSEAPATALVAVHSWDIAGAHHAGLTTGWCSRAEAVRTAVFDEADEYADTLDAVIAALAGLPEKH